MLQETPFILMPWQHPFLPLLKNHIMRETHGKPGSALIITPNKRPWRYLVELFKTEKKTVALPKLLPFAEVAALWRGNALGNPKHLANTLDQVALLRQCIHSVASQDALLAAKFDKMPVGAYLPWGLRLAALFEELFSNGLTGRDIPYSEDNINDPAAKILGALGRIGQAWQELLDQKNWTTPGYDNLLAAKSCQTIPPLLMPTPQRQIFIAGFSTLNGVQQKLFHTLWQQGAQICVQGDIKLASGQDSHPACDELKKWAQKWHAGWRVPIFLPKTSKENVYHFYAAYDEHSQLRQLHDDILKNHEPKGMAAIILPNPDLLMPVLHEIPDKNVNISMGYPLSRAPLATLFKQIFTTAANRRDNGNIYWQDALALFQLPFITMLSPNKNAPDQTFRSALAQLDHKIRTGAKYADLEEIVREICAGYPDSTGQLLRQCWQIMLVQPAAVDSTAKLAENLRQICQLLQDYGQNMLERFPLDVEALARLQDSIIPVLQYNEMADEKLSHEMLFQLLMDLLAEERIAFEAEPLVGLQILGMLETRLLHFDAIYVLDASDDLLPGSKAQDPLLPDSLRPLLGLPDAAARHAVVGYNLMRLCASARDAYFYWAEGSSPGRLASAKKYRSRFVEQLIWNIESKKQKQLLKTGEAPIHAAVSTARTCRKTPGSLARGPLINQGMTAILNGNLSATLLKNYLSCPYRFILEKLLGLQSPAAINEGDDPQLVGACVHAALEDFFNAKKNRLLEDIAEHEDELMACLNNKIQELGLPGLLPPTSLIAFELAAPARLKTYLQNFPEDAIVLECEKRATAKLHLNQRDYTFALRFDRIDQRNTGLHILDYKTGTPHLGEPQIWLDKDFFGQLTQYMQTCNQFDEKGDELLGSLRDNMPDPQMPLYMLLGEVIYGKPPANAVIVDLKNNGKELELFKSMSLDEEAIARQHCAIAISFILAHMEKCQKFAPALASAACDYCQFANGCGVGA